MIQRIEAQKKTCQYEKTWPFFGVPFLVSRYPNHFGPMDPWPNIKGTKPLKSYRVLFPRNHAETFINPTGAWKGAGEIWGYLKSQPNRKQGATPRFPSAWYIVQFGSVPNLWNATGLGHTPKRRQTWKNAYVLGYLTSLWYWVASFYVVSLREYMLFNWLFCCSCSLQVNAPQRQVFPCSSNIVLHCFRIQLGWIFPCHVRVLDRVNCNICFVIYMNNTYL